MACHMFETRPVSVGFEVDKMAMQDSLLAVVYYSLSVSFHLGAIHI